MSVEDLVDLPSGKYVHAVTVVDMLGGAVFPHSSVTPEFEIAQTGYYKRRVASYESVIARRRK